MKKTARIFVWILSFLVVVVIAALMVGYSFRIGVGPAQEEMVARAVYAPNEV